MDCFKISKKKKKIGRKKKARVIKKFYICS